MAGDGLERDRRPSVIEFTQCMDGLGRVSSCRWRAAAARGVLASGRPPGSKQRTFNDTRGLCRPQAYPVFGLLLTEYLGRTLLTSENGVER
jgi:hypothetical protein